MQSQSTVGSEPRFDPSYLLTFCIRIEQVRAGQPTRAFPIGSFDVSATRALSLNLTHQRVCNARQPVTTGQLARNPEKA